MRAKSEAPGWEPFFETIAHDFVIIAESCGVCLELSIHAQGEDEKGEARPDEKKPDPKARLRYWPREADTITFQEGLLNRHVTGGGGHMRDATAQRLSTMILISAVQQPSRQHVRHAVSAPSIK